jgi:hypothetical protein
MKSHLTIAFIQFSFDTQVDFNNFKVKIEELSDLEDNQVSFFDKNKYHKHIEKLITNTIKNEKNSDSAFLKITKIKTETLQKIQEINYNKQYTDLILDNNQKMEFSNHNYLVLNEFAKIGYFVFGFKISSKHGIKDFIESKFFRFIDGEPKYQLIVKLKEKDFSTKEVPTYNIDMGLKFDFEDINNNVKSVYFPNNPETKEIKIEVKNRTISLRKETKDTLNYFVLRDKENMILDRWKINPENEIERTELYSFNILELIKALYPGIIPNPNDPVQYLDFDQNQKPILLNLFEADYNLLNNESKLAELLQRSIRISSPRNSNKYIDENNRLSESCEIQFFISSEGSSIMDLNVDPTKTKHTNDLFNLYFPAFILALNQRQLMIEINKKISDFQIKELDSLISNVENREHNKKLIKEIEKLKKKVGLYKFRQVIHSVSFNDDIAKFYAELLSSFDIKLLLEDNESSVMEMSNILNEEYRKKRDIESDFQSNLVLMFSVFGGATYLVSFPTFMESCNWNWMLVLFLYILVPVVVFLVINKIIKIK